MINPNTFIFCCLTENALVRSPWSFKIWVGGTPEGITTCILIYGDSSRTTSQVLFLTLSLNSDNYKWLVIPDTRYLQVAA